MTITPDQLDQRACKNAHTARFFDECPENLQYIRVEYCSRCPILQHCEEWALSNFTEIKYGIWAGWNSEQRHNIATGRREYRPWYQTSFARPGYRSVGIAPPKSVVSLSRRQR